jgi:2'-5' RNA ligase
MAPNSWLSLVLAPATKDSLETCIARIQTESPVPLDPMSKVDMHMTLVFLGSNMRGVVPAKRAELQKALEVFTADAPADSALEFKVLELFPPTKRNLLIAKYIIKGKELEALRKLQMACYEIGLVSEEEHAKSQSTEFVGHVTLGKFRGMRADQSSAVQKAIAKVNSLLDGTARQSLLLPFEAACLCGGG